MDIEKYKAYSAEDFILDENFLKLVKGHTIDGFSLEHFEYKLPEKRKEIAFAVKLITGLQTTKIDIPDERKILLLDWIFKSNRNQTRFTLLRYVAAILVIAALGVSGLYFINRQSEIENFASSTTVRLNKAELILADGKRVEIENKQSKIEYTGDGTTVLLNDTSLLEQTKPVSGESFNQVIVPCGKRSTILLSDGTQVWLNSGSRLIYPPVFNKKNREIFLEGEAYFEVSKDKSRPFLVHTDEFQVKVLGTKFLVQAFKNENEYNTLLIEGSVCLAKKDKFSSDNHVLQPNQYAKLSKSKEDFSITIVSNATDYIGWVHGYMNFENEEILTIVKRISRYYNIDIVVNANNIDTRYSGKLDLKDDPERILIGLSTITKTKYEKQGDKYVIYN